MTCYNCGKDADMEIVVMVNGQMQKVQICMDCYQSEMNKFINTMKAFNQDIDVEDIQKAMFDFMQDNKDQIDNMFGQDFKVENLNFNDLNLNDLNMEDMAENITDLMEDKSKKEDEIKDVKAYEIKMLKKNALNKRMKLSEYVEREEYLAAALLRDQIKEINEKLMNELELEYENEK